MHVNRGRNETDVTTASRRRFSQRLVFLGGAVVPERCSSVPMANIKDTMRQMCKNYTSNFPSGDGYCPGELDIWGLCWNATPPGETARQVCPDKENSYAYRDCWANGTWFVHPHFKDKTSWTNYTACLNTDELEFRSFINNLYVIGYSISLVTLIISLAIFFVFRSLKCTRIRMHIHLFVSLALNNIMWIIWYREVIGKAEDGRMLPNPVWCQAVFLFSRYFMLTNYMWMFCEALYLHLSLVVVFVRDEVAMRWFLAIGWGASFLIMLIYALYRLLDLKDTNMCWMNEFSFAQWILTVPVCVSLLASLIFLINVLRVILNVMHPRTTDPATVGVRRAARAAVILIPLFGLHYLLLPFRPTDRGPYERVYEYVSVTITSLQGLCVSCLFCFANHDVHQAIRAYIHRQMHSSRWSNYYYTGGIDSAGVYVINANSNSNTNNLALI